MSWRDRAREVIAQIHERLGPNATYQERAKALREGYPFGLRRYSPYKIWLSEQTAYLERHSPKPAGPLDLRPYEADEIRDAIERTIEE
jgi:hypothetical protein